VTFSGFPHPPRQPPTIGADTEQTLSEVLELQPDALADLKRSGAIA
jgi:crotonobetainyl-CoA:carnitine CoA-transferase CaiB-like acyl-CoA transferase